MALFALTPIPPPLSLTLVRTSTISILLVPSAEVTLAFGADADNQARERLVLACVLIAFAVGLSCFRFLYHSVQGRITRAKTRLDQTRLKSPKSVY